MKNTKQPKVKHLGLKILSAICVIAVVAAASTVLYLRARDISELPVQQLSPMTGYDHSNPYERAGYADYVFVARVTKKLRTEQERLKWFDYLWPCTFYEVEVLENIKGNLQLGTIEIKKTGGVEVAGPAAWLGIRRLVIVYNNDFLPEAGNTYLFYAVADENGVVFVTSGYSNILLAQAQDPFEGAAPPLNNLESNPEYQKALEAVENEIPYERERFIATADAANTD